MHSCFDDIIDRLARIETKLDTVIPQVEENTGFIQGVKAVGRFLGFITGVTGIGWILEQLRGHH